MDDFHDTDFKIASEHEHNEVPENNLQLEEGPLDLSLDFSFSGSARFYNLQVEDTVDQLNYDYDSGEVEPLAGYLGDRIVFSPGGNEGYTCSWKPEMTCKRKRRKPTIKLLGR